jgi:hypothetical protein
MNKRLKRQAALYVLIRLVDENEGFIDINSDAVINSFSDEDQIVKAKLADGTIALAADLDTDVLDKAVLKWLDDNPHQASYIMSKINFENVHKMKI